MSNHYHMVLRNRPDLVKQLSDREVISRWWRLTNYRAKASPEVKEQLMQRWLADREMIFKLRKRLSSISWMMSSLAQPIAVAANREDEVSGRFWQGRFDCWRIQTLQHLLSAMMYVDLNPIRAGMAKSLERSRYTSICRRIKSFKRRKKVARIHPVREERAVQELLDEWISPIEIEPPSRAKSDQKKSASMQSRASDDGCLPMTLEKYLSILDWTGRQIHARKRGRIPAGVPPILRRLGIKGSKEWLNLFQGYANNVARKFGKPVNQAAEAARCVVVHESN